MKLLIVTASLPYPPQQGGALRTFGILQGLHQAGHEIHLLSFQDSGAVTPASTPLHELCSHIETLPTPGRSKSSRLRDLVFSGHPDIARRLYSPDFERRLLAMVAQNRYDVVQFEGIEVASYLFLLRQGGTSSRLCYDSFNAEAALQRVIFEVDREDITRWAAAGYSLIQSGRIAQFERELCQQADLVIAVSDEDAAILREYRSDRRVSVVPNGIFADSYTDASEQLELGEQALVFTGKMDYRPNVDAVFWFTDAILPLIQRHYPNAHLYVVGQKPHPRLEKLRDVPGIEITGWVQDVKPYLRGASVYVAPLRMGSGTRLKILEAMAAQCAVVATSLAASGLRDDAEDALRIADTPQQIADAVISLLSDPRQRQALGGRASDYVRQHYDWSKLIPRLMQAYQGVGVG
ncbi:MAG: glycosyltransferase [Anaerolineae bacterium]|nr:glycosyltransferase [Anaerolineae bacterium]